METSREKLLVKRIYFAKTRRWIEKIDIFREFREKRRLDKAKRIAVRSDRKFWNRYRRESTRIKNNLLVRRIYFGKTRIWARKLVKNKV